MAGPYQAIKFVMLDFDQNWDRTMLVTRYANIRYTATRKGGQLAVVFEGATGTMRTYRYRVASGQEVFVVDQVVHIPARCRKEELSNTIKCGT
jgi:NADPH-dependent ferric siderophore reductase